MNHCFSKTVKIGIIDIQTSRIYAMISGSFTEEPGSLTDLNNLTSCESARGE